MRLAGHEIAPEALMAPGNESAGNEAWQRAKRLALEFNARERRN